MKERRASILQDIERDFGVCVSQSALDARMTELDVHPHLVLERAKANQALQAFAVSNGLAEREQMQLQIVYESAGISPLYLCKSGVLSLYDVLRGTEHEASCATAVGRHLGVCVDVERLNALLDERAESKAAILARANQCPVLARVRGERVMAAEVLVDFYIFSESMSPSLEHLWKTRIHWERYVDLYVAEIQAAIDKYAAPTPRHQIRKRRFDCDDDRHLDGGMVHPHGSWQQYRQDYLDGMERDLGIVLDPEVLDALFTEKQTNPEALLARANGNPSIIALAEVHDLSDEDKRLLQIAADAAPGSEEAAYDALVWFLMYEVNHADMPQQAANRLRRGQPNPSEQPDPK